MSAGTTTGFPGLTPLSPWRAVIDAINRLLTGRLNATTSVTLVTSSTTTTLTWASITPNSFIGLMPTTSNAAGALATTYISARSKGSATITHASNSQADRTFTVLVIG